MVYRKKGNIAEETAAMLNRCNEAAARRGWVLIGWADGEPFRAVVVTCPAAHTFEQLTRPLLYKDPRCPFCSNRGIFNREEAVAALAKVNLWLLNSPKLDTDIAKAECSSCEAQIEDTFGKLRRNTVKCKCRRIVDSSFVNENNLHNYVTSKGGWIHDSRPVLQKEKVKITCSNNHEWTAQVGSLLLQKTWCPKCAGNSPRSLADLERIVTARGGTLLTREYRGVDGTYEFLCNLGHQNRNMFKKIEKGQWCPTCNRHSKSEEITRTILENLFKTKFPKRRPDWLRNSRGRLMELDGFAEELAIAFEYQGAQHFMDSTLYRTDLAQRRLDDEAKARLCRENNVTLLIFTYLEKFDDFHRITEMQLREAGVGVDLDFSAPVDYQSAYIRNDRLDELKALLAPKQIKVLSTKWTKVDSFYDFECLVCGTTYKARANSYFNSRRVSGCDYCARRTPSNKKTIDSLRDYARKHKGVLVSDKYIRRNHTYTWRCQAGHDFEANFNNLASRGVFCGICENRQTKEFITQQEAFATFEEYGFKLVGDYSGRTRYSKTVCAKCGFEGSQILENLRNGRRDCKGCLENQRESDARALLARVLLRPLSPYPGIYAPWLCQCLKCLKEVSPNIWNISRGQGPCKFCARASRATKSASEGTL